MNGNDERDYAEESAQRDAYAAVYAAEVAAERICAAIGHDSAFPPAQFTTPGAANVQNYCMRCGVTLTDDGAHGVGNLAHAGSAAIWERVEREQAAADWGWLDA